MNTIAEQSEHRPGLRQWFSESVRVFCEHWPGLFAGALIQALMPIVATSMCFLLLYQSKATCIRICIAVFGITWLWAMAGYIKYVLDLCRTGKATLRTLINTPIRALALFEAIQLMKRSIVSVVILGFAAMIISLCSRLTMTLFTGAFFWTATCILYLHSTEKPIVIKEKSSKVRVSLNLLLIASVFFITQLFLTGFSRTLIQLRYVAQDAMEPRFPGNTSILFESASKLLNKPIHRGEVLLFEVPPPLVVSEVSPSVIASAKEKALLFRLTGLGEDGAHLARVIGLPGDHIRIVKGIGVFVNGAKLDEESYVDDPLNYDLNVLADIGAWVAGGTYFQRVYGIKVDPIVVPSGQLFMLGDSRNNSEDSRNWGFLNQNAVIGKAWFEFRTRPEFMCRFVEIPPYSGIQQVDFAPYMKRMEVKLKGNWLPPKVTKSCTVITNFTLHANGRVSDVKVIKSSGFSEVDLAAVAAVNKSAPLEPLPSGSAAQVPVNFNFDFVAAPSSS